MLTATAMKQTLLSSSNIPQIEHQTDPQFKKGTKRKGKTRIEDRLEVF